LKNLYLIVKAESKEFKTSSRNKNETGKNLAYNTISQYNGNNPYLSSNNQYPVENSKNNLYGQRSGYNYLLPNDLKFTPYVSKNWVNSLDYPQIISDTQLAFIELVEKSFMNTKYLIGNYNKHYVSF